MDLKVHAQLSDLIASSRAEILSLDDDWDDMGACGYTQDTWLRAESFVRNQHRWLLKARGEALPIPEILPGPQGGIDIHWMTEKAELLVHIPADSEDAISFYGDDFGKTVIKGTLASDKLRNVGLTDWLCGL